MSRSIIKPAKYLLSKLSYEFKNIASAFFIEEAIRLLIYTIYYKDTSLFITWFTNLLQKIIIKKHRRVLSFLNKATKLLKRKGYFTRLKCIGFYFDVRGKVGVTGSKKKRHVMIKHGLYSNSKKSTKMVSNQGIVVTKTGSLGVTLTLTY